MERFDTEIGNIASLIFLALIVLGSVYIKRNYDLRKDSIRLISGFRYVCCAVMIGLTWWILAHHGIDVDPGPDSFWHQYKGHMRLVGSGLIGAGFVQFFRAFHVEDPKILAPVFAIVYGVAFLIAEYIGA